MSGEFNFDEQQRILAEEQTGEIVMYVQEKGWIALSAHYEEQQPTVIVQRIAETEAPADPAQTSLV